MCSSFTWCYHIMVSIGVSIYIFSSGWCDISDTDEYAAYCKLTSGLHNHNAVQCSLRVYDDFSWVVIYGGRRVEPS